MKIVKTIMILFVLTCVTSMMNVKADETLAFLGVKIPAFQDDYTSPSVAKTTWSDQYVKSTGAVDGLTGDDRAVKARLYGTESKYTELVDGSWVQLDSGATGLGTAPGNYKLQVASVKWLTTSATWSGVWVLDEYILPKD